MHLLLSGSTGAFLEPPRPHFTANAQAPGSRTSHSSSGLSKESGTWKSPEQVTEEGKDGTSGIGRIRNLTHPGGLTDPQTKCHTQVPRLPALPGQGHGSYGPQVASEAPRYRHKQQPQEGSRPGSIQVAAEAPP